LPEPTDGQDDACPSFPQNIGMACTAVVHGHAKLLVLFTGSSTQVGHIALSLGMDESGLTPVQKTMNRLARLIAIAMVILVSCIFMVSFFFRINDPAKPLSRYKGVCFIQLVFYPKPCHQLLSFC
jgi:magnesium-transporting ATPase (P-type)